MRLAGPLACALVAAGAALAGCGSPKQSGPAPVEVIEINEVPLALPGADDPVYRPKSHTVREGETLGEIALLYGLDYTDLALWNNIPNPDLIEIGQRLQLSPPGTVPEVTPIAPVKAEKPVLQRAAGEPAVAARPGGVTRTQVGVGGRATARQAAVAQVSEPTALKIPYSEGAAERLLGQSGGAELASLSVRGSASPGGPPPNTRERNGIVWSWPVNGQLSSRFSEDNKGIDISGPRGQPIYASARGRVIYAGSGLKGYGQLVIIKHSNEYLSTYAHNDKIFVAEGEEIERGQLIAEMGDTGSDKVALHFEIRRGSDAFDPQQFLPKNP